jgi:acetyl esterase/lipase
MTRRSCVAGAWFVLVAAVVCGGPVGEPVASAQALEQHKDLVYARIDGKSLALDLYLPTGVQAPPLLVWVHGGAWTTGSKASVPPVFLANGFAVASVDFRQSTEARFPAQVHDIKAAIRYLRHYAGTLGIARTRIGLWGESAGGHLAALAGLTDAVHPSLEGTEGIAQGDTTVGAVVDWYGITDVGALLPDAPGPHDPFVTFLGGDPADRPHLAAAASPVSYARFPAPPFLLVHGTHDTLVPFEHSERLAGLLRAAGNHAELVAVPGAEHIFLNADVAPVVARCVAFLAHHLRRLATDRTA